MGRIILNLGYLMNEVVELKLKIVDLRVILIEASDSVTMLDDTIHSLIEVILATTIALYALGHIIIDSSLPSQWSILLLIEGLPVTSWFSQPLFSTRPS